MGVTFISVLQGPIASAITVYRRSGFRNYWLRSGCISYAERINRNNLVSLSQVGNSR